jgi:hypothetical protein
MLTGFKLLHASLPAPILHKTFDAIKALSWRMTGFLTNMSTFQWDATWLSTVRFVLTAVNAITSFFAACTSFGD